MIILLIILSTMVYLILAGIVAAAAIIKTDDEFMQIAFGAFWPITICVLIGIKIYQSIADYKEKREAELPTAKTVNHVR